MPLKTAPGDIGWLPIENLTQRNRSCKEGNDRQTNPSLSQNCFDRKDTCVIFVNG